MSTGKETSMADPQIVTFEDITAATYLIKPGIIHTPATYTHLSEICKMDLYLKNEYLQYTGSFKERGARYCLIKLTPEERSKGVVSASSGNFALAISYHAMKLGVKATVVCPVTTTIMKVQQCTKFGATVISHGKNLEESQAYGMKLAEEKGHIYLNGFDNPNAIAGYGTVGLEICHEVPNCDAVIVGVGGGGFIAGVSKAIKTLKPNVEIIGVESAKCAGFTESVKLGFPQKVESIAGLADALEVQLIGRNALATAKPFVDKMVTVNEDYIALAILRIIEMEKCVIEGAGAIGIAAILQGLLPHLNGKRVVAILGGGNIDTIILGRCLDRGLAADGRLMRLTVIVADRPGGVADLIAVLSKNGGCIKDITHERAWVRGNVFGVKITVVVETRDIEHSRAIVAKLKESFDIVRCTIETTAIEGTVKMASLAAKVRSEYTAS